MALSEEEQEKFNRLSFLVAEAIPVLHLVLAAYLRGMGKRKEAELLVIDPMEGPQGAGKFIENLNKLYEEQEIPREIAVFALQQLAIHILVAHSPRGYAADIIKSDEGREEMASTLDGMGVSGLARLVRSNPIKVEQLARKGMVDVLGDATEELNDLYDKLVRESFN
ncbi:MAG: hypothetical protein AMJ53_11295 [Gammaproteobacteria bacterium SG8_11]|nr:MAG: hypothetical protein AMJ53_11295 [Gammaproteobacteria bacterium SG8_11]